MRHIKPLAVIIFLLLVCQKQIVGMGFANAFNQKLDSLVSAYYADNKMSIDSCKAMLTNIISLAKEHNSQKHLAIAYSAMGRAYDREYDLDNARVWHLRAQELQSQIISKDIHFLIKNNIAQHYSRHSEDRKAEGIYKMLKPLQSEVTSALYLLFFLTDIAEFYSRQAHSGGDSTFLDSAELYLNKASILAGELENYHYLMITHNSLGALNYNQEKYDDSQRHYSKALQISEKLNDNSGSAACLVNLGSIFYSRHQTDSAIAYYHKALRLFTLGNYAYEIMQTYFMISDAYASQNKYFNALSYYRKGDLLYDSLFTLEKEKVINDLHIKYETEKKENLLQQQLRKTEKAEAVSKKRMMIEVILFVLLGGIITISLFAYRVWKQKHAIARQELEIKNQRINKLLKEQELRSFSYLLEGQDKERERIASDLHDRLGGLLATIKTYFQAFQEGVQALDDKTAKQYNKAESLLNYAVDEVRSISHNLSSGVLKKFGLLAALQDLGKTIETTGQLKVSLFISGNKKELGARTEINIYRIIQELFSNSLKHAEATKVTLQLNFRDDVFNISFEDNGKGFDIKSIKQGMGISNIETRVAQLNGEWSIDSVNKRGTIVIIDIPYS